ncbi:unnamed protein product [Pleuronectes platessa]|uniref:Uncharacterized protein n=1 Tax=Pleuronectes platessa TaxID=8262 RepID=A0A9N7YMA5_PLEPL|nr:unnamed protein product [Pleuronectes platessa]
MEAARRCEQVGVDGPPPLCSLCLLVFISTRRSLEHRVDVIRRSCSEGRATAPRMEIPPWLGVQHDEPRGEITLVDFKVLLLTYKALSGLAPGYIADSLGNYVPSRPLRSTAASAASLSEVPDNS